MKLMLCIVCMVADEIRKFRFIFEGKEAATPKNVIPFMYEMQLSSGINRSLHVNKTFDSNDY